MNPHPDSTKGYTLADSEEFEPYLRYKKATREIDSFVEMTVISYGLTQHLLLHEESGDRPRRPQTEAGPASWTEADIDVESAEWLHGWISLNDCAARMSVDPEIVRMRALRGDLGPVEAHPETGESMVLWPPEVRDLPDAELPRAGQSIWRVTMRRNAYFLEELDIGEPDPATRGKIQNRFLQLARSLGDTAEVATRAASQLYRSGFLLHWTAFEVFLRQAVRSLLLRHPLILTQSKKSKDFSKGEVISLLLGSRTLEGVIEHIVDQEVAGLSGAHSLINYLKSNFHFEKDPYASWYFFREERLQTSYRQLMEARKLRNIFVHEEEQARQVENSVSEMSAELYWEYRLVFRSICHSITTSIVRDKYCVSDTIE